MKATAFWICVLLPWFLAAGAAAGPAAVTVHPSYQTIGGGTMGAVVVMYDGAGVAEGLRGFHLVIDYDETLVTVVDPELDVWEGSLLSHIGETAFYVVQEDANSIVIDCAILGKHRRGVRGRQPLHHHVHRPRAGRGCEPRALSRRSRSATSTTTRSRTPRRTARSTWTTRRRRPPTIYPEPEFTQGTTNTIDWTDESW